MGIFIKSIRLFLVFVFCLSTFSFSIAQEKLTEIVKKIVPSTVVIFSYDDKGNLIKQGTGFFININGVIITNRHVLIDTDFAEIKTAWEEIYNLTHIEAEDAEGDIIFASANVPKEKIRPLVLSSESPEVGERIAVIGSPLGFEQTVSDGIVSAIREIPGLGKIIQITAPISPGSSGSPVVNMKGKVIGIASFQVSKGQSLNFAIPGERAARINLSERISFYQWKIKVIEAAAKEYFDEGIRWYSKSNYEEALKRFEKAVKIKPDYVWAHNSIGACKYHLGRKTEAIEAYKQVIEIDPDNSYAYYDMGLSLLDLRRNVEAEKAFIQVLRIMPNHIRAKYNLGISFRRQGLYKKAIQELNQVINIWPSHAEAHFYLGSTYIRAGNKSAAIEVYNTLKDLDKKLAKQLYNEIVKSYKK